MSRGLIVARALLVIVGGIGVWFAGDLARHDKKSSRLGVVFYRPGQVEVEDWRVRLHRLVSVGVVVLGVFVLVAGVVSALR